MRKKIFFFFLDLLASRARLLTPIPTIFQSEYMYAEVVYGCSAAAHHKLLLFEAAVKVSS